MVLVGAPATTPGISVSLVARRHYRAQFALSAVGASEEMLTASEYRALQTQVCELQRLLSRQIIEKRR
jgi:transposase